MEVAGPKTPLLDSSAIKVCPKCGYHPSRPDDDLYTKGECLACGIVVKKYLRHQARLAEAAANVNSLEPSVAQVPPYEEPPAPFYYEQNYQRFNSKFMRCLTLEFLLPSRYQESSPSEGAAPSAARRLGASLASWGHMFYLIAIFLVPMRFLILEVILLIAGRQSPNRGDLDARADLGMMSSVLISLILSFLYLPRRWSGSTFGQRLMGIQMCKRASWLEEPGRGQLILRSIFLPIAVLGFLVPPLKGLTEPLSSIKQIDVGVPPRKSFLASLQPWGAFALVILAFFFLARMPRMARYSAEKIASYGDPSVPNDFHPGIPFKINPGPPRSQEKTVNWRNILIGIYRMEEEYRRNMRSDGSTLSDRLTQYAGRFSDKDFGPYLSKDGHLQGKELPDGYEIGIFADGTWQVISSHGGITRRPEF
jgi:hypothetical protein